MSNPPWLRWKKSSRSGGSGGNCVEVAFSGDAVVIRDSKCPAGPVLLTGHAGWQGLIDAVKAGRFSSG